jgi:hypothetical protein
MPSRLPIAVAPAHHEIAASYIARLANLHGIAFPGLWQQVSRPRTENGAARFIAGDRLAAVTGIPETRPARAVIDRRRPEPDWQAFRHEPQHGCPRCTARRSARWFACNRKGGRGILYHRHVGPVLARDWARHTNARSSSAHRDADFGHRTTPALAHPGRSPTWTAYSTVATSLDKSAGPSRSGHRPSGVTTTG